MHDYNKICRICMSSGSRDIFHRSNIDPSSPLERLLEKMRYVTMMKIEENDDLPRLICDLCIVQLNVAYNFKRQAVENDTKLRQYFIEHGITSHHSTESSENANNSNTINQTSNNNCSITKNNSHNKNSTTNNVEATRVRPFTPTNSAAISPIIRRVTNNFPIMPIIVKTEPENDILADDLSDSVLENNVGVNPHGALTESTISNENVSNSNRIQLNNTTSSMVYLNGYTINTLTPSSEVESYHNISTNNTITNVNSIQLSNGLSSSFGSLETKSGSKIDSNKSKSKSQQKTKSLSPAEITRKKMAQKRLGGQLKTRRIMPEEKVKSYIESTLQTLRIDMAPPGGKMSREEMKKKRYCETIRKEPDSAEKSISNENTRKKNSKLLSLNPTVVLNPFNTRKRNAVSENLRPSRKSSAQKTSSTEKTKVIRSNQSREISKSTNRKTKKYTTDARSQITLIKPKLEPTSSN